MRATFVDGPRAGDEVDVPMQPTGPPQVILIPDNGQIFSAVSSDDEIVRVGRYDRTGYDTYRWRGWDQ